MSESDNCTKITEICTFEISTYGYRPSLPANAIFLALFAIFCAANLGLGVYYKTWTYMIAVCLGSLTEAIGYVGRIIMHSNPFIDTGFITQICCLIIAPAFNCAAIYLILKHVALTFGSEWSLVKPRFYTYIFIAFDLLSLILQGAGGGIASTANDEDQQKLGDNLMMAGIAWQVAALSIFAVVAGLYAWRRWQATKKGHALSPAAAATLQNTKFRLFIFGAAIAWLTIFTRCVYRIIEMAGGWRNPIMQDQASFIALEGV
jgi:hypothetical protein